MSERSDAQIKRALKDSVAGSLEGWEFTPAMRQTVLRQIAREEAEPAPAPETRSWAQRSRPFIWVGAAAAVLVLAVNIPGMISGFGFSQKASEAPRAANSKPRDPKPQQAQEAAKAESAVASNSTITAEAKDSAKSTITAQATAQPPAGTPGASGNEAVSIRQAPAAPARILLVAPEADGPAVSIAAVPVAPETKTLPAKAGESLAMVSVGTQAAVRTRGSVQLIDQGGALVWEKPLAGGPGPLVAWQGKIATSAGSELYVFDTDGRQELKLSLPGAPEGIAIAPDGRVAALTGPTGHQTNLTLTVYQNGRVQFQVNGLGGPQFAFGPDGSLAVVRNGLELYGRDGNRLWQVPLKGSGFGVAFGAGGDVILAGTQAFHRSGQPLWEVSQWPQGWFVFGADGPVAFRDNSRLTLVNPRDGMELWTAETGGLEILDMALSERGDQMAVLARGMEANAVPVVWVLDLFGGQRYAARLPSDTFGVAIEGDTLFLLTDGGVETRQLPPR